MSKSLEINEQDIIRYYETCESDYRLLWHLSEQHAMHYGYWKEDTALLRDALRNMNDFVLEKLNIQSGNRLLDAGCGIGGTALYAARKYGCAVTGITLSPKQCAKARILSIQKNLSDKVSFEIQNYTQTSFGNHSFHGIYGIESICHASSKSHFLREAFRLIIPSGRLVVADFFKTAHAERHSDEECLRKWAETWAVPDFAETELFIEEAKKEGFRLITNENITERIHKSARRLYQYFFPGIFCHSILWMIGLRNRVQGKNMWSTYYQYKSLQSKLWEYRVIVFEKPKDNG